MPRTIKMVLMHGSKLGKWMTPLVGELMDPVDVVTNVITNHASMWGW